MNRARRTKKQLKKCINACLSKLVHDLVSFPLLVDGKSKVSGAVRLVLASCGAGLFQVSRSAFNFDFSLARP